MNRILVRLHLFHLHQLLLVMNNLKNVLKNLFNLKIRQAKKKLRSQLTS